MKIAGNVFKAYDIRGRVGVELTNDLAYGVGRALADWLEVDGPVAVGYDMRPDSKELASHLIAGLTRQGRDVWNVGLVASDMIYFAVGKFELAGGAVVTASHNPGEYNGIKLCRERAGGISLESGLQHIRDAALADSYQVPAREGKVTEKDVMADWVDHVLSFIDTSNLPGYRAAADAGNGMAGAVLPHLAKRLKVSIKPLYWELDGTFPNHEANPLKSETLKDLQTAITANHLDFGMAFDGDGDRAVLVDETGRLVSGSILTAIIAKSMLADNPGATILYNANCSKIVPETVEALGGTAIRTKVGHSFIKDKMKETGAIFAGEHSAHYYFKDNYNADSGLIAAMKAIDILAKSGQKLSELVKEFDKYYSIEETNFTIEDKDTVIERLAERYRGADQDRLDGLTVRLDSGAWFIVRPSNTEPLMRLNAEADTQTELEALVNEVSAIIKA